jgi:hypothetical protein
VIIAPAATHSDALLDEVVLIVLELYIQLLQSALLLDPRVLHPFLVDLDLAALVGYFLV